MNSVFFRNPINVQALPEVVRAKWPVELLDEGVVPVPKKLLRTFSELFSGPSGVEKIVALIAIADFKRPNYKLLPSIEFLAFLAGLSEEKFISALLSMKNEGMLEVENVQDRVDVNISGLTKKVLKLTNPRGYSDDIPI